jgi:hypothetical protein
MQAETAQAPAAPAAPPLNPVARIPISSNVGGQLDMPTVEFDSAGSLLYIQRAVQPWPVVAKWYLPDAAFVLALSFLAWAIWRARRVARQPQVTGRLYCRTCNYDLTPAVNTAGRGLPKTGLSIAERCPECGADTARRRPRAGRSRTWRISGLLLLAWLIHAGSIVVGVLTLERFQRTRWSTLETWPIAGIDTVAPGFAIQKSQPPWPAIVRLDRYELPSGRYRDTLARLPRDAMANDTLSPSGTRCVLLRHSLDPGNPVFASVIDTTTGDSRDFPLPPGMFSSAQVVGFSKDSARVYIQTQGSLPGMTMNRPGNTFKSSLLELTLDSGFLRAIADVDTGYTLSGQSQATPTQRFAVLERGDKIIWALFTDRSAITTAGMPAIGGQVLWSESPGTPPIDVRFSGRAFLTPILTSDGATLRIPIWSTPDFAEIDLQARTQRVVTDPAGLLSSRAPAAHRGLRTGTGTLDLIDAADGSTLATLWVGTGTNWLSGSWISRDGKWAAAFITRPTKAWFGPPSSIPAAGDILVWDLSALAPAPRSPKP